MPWIIFVVPILSIISTILIILASSRFQKIDPKSRLVLESGGWLQKISEGLSLHVRIYVFFCCVAWLLEAGTILYFISPGMDGFIKAIIRVNGFTALFLLFATLTPGLLKVYLPGFILDSLLIKARRALGISTYLFALVHGLIAFVYYYGSLEKIPTLSLGYQLAFYFAAGALLIFTLLALTSSDKMVEILTFQKWKTLHRFIYLAFLLSILHSLIRGTHLNAPYNTFTAILIFLTLTFILLECCATVIYLFNHNFAKSPIKNSLILGLLTIIGFSAFYLSIVKLDLLY